MSCGMTAMPPRRAMVSAMRRPETAVMLATTIGMVAPVPSDVERSTSNRDVTSERPGTMNTSLYVRSCAGCSPLRNFTARVYGGSGGAALRCRGVDEERDAALAAHAHLHGA